MTTQLNNSIQNLYTVFAVYPGNANMHGSPIYTDLKQWNPALFAKPLQLLSSEDLALFTGKAMTTWGEIDDFKHFLPRMLELTARLDIPFDVGILYNKVDYADWNNWNSTEQNALKEFNSALWSDLLSNESDKAETEFESYFGALANFFPDLSDMLSAWINNDSYSSLLHLANYVHDNFNRLFLKSSVGLKEEHTVELKKWLISKPVIDKLTTGFFRFENTDDSSRISISLNLLETEQRVINTN